ncbi:MAG: hypothetical protein JNJ83_23845 [Verrucomicrobiaceae bacterium]|nr:hypothetical protein [Verrucomicrobiaceae bacterium]
MPQASIKYDTTPDQSSPVLREDGIEYGFIGRLQGLNDNHRSTFTDSFLAIYELRQTISRYMVKCIDDNDNGFVWHTTGSGKTLTSFNASTLATLLPKLLSGEIKTIN